MLFAGNRAVCGNPVVPKQREEFLLAPGQFSCPGETFSFLVNNSAYLPGWLPVCSVTAGKTNIFQISQSAGAHYVNFGVFQKG